MNEPNISRYEHQVGSWFTYYHYHRLSAISYTVCLRKRNPPALNAGSLRMVDFDFNTVA